MLILPLALIAATAPPATATATPDGVWVSGCIAMGKDGRHGTIVRLTIAGKRIDAVAQTYARADCDVPTIETRLTASRDTLTVTDGAIDAALTVGDVTMTPENAEVVSIWNRDRAAKDCAPEDWRLDQPQSVAGKSCTPGVTFPKRGTRLSSHATLAGDTLSLPSPFDGADAGGGQATLTLTRASAQ